jgi:beta-glucosidase-like glycosyl hydrolase
MNNWLRQELGFDGIIICDDFSMASVRGPASARIPAAAQGTDRIKPEVAAVLSLAAGADMVLVWPPDLRRTHRAILGALPSEGGLNDSTLSYERLLEAATRVIFEKIRMGLITNEE